LEHGCQEFSAPPWEAVGLPYGGINFHARFGSRADQKEQNRVPFFSPQSNGGLLPTHPTCAPRKSSATSRGGVRVRGSAGLCGAGRTSVRRGGMRGSLRAGRRRARGERARGRNRRGRGV